MVMKRGSPVETEVCNAQCHMCGRWYSSRGVTRHRDSCAGSRTRTRQPEQPNPPLAQQAAPLQQRHAPAHLNDDNVDVDNVSVQGFVGFDENSSMDNPGDDDSRDQDHEQSSISQEGSQGGQVFDIEIDVPEFGDEHQDSTDGVLVSWGIPIPELAPKPSISIRPVESIAESRAAALEAVFPNSRTELEGANPEGSSTSADGNASEPGTESPSTAPERVCLHPAVTVELDDKMYQIRRLKPHDQAMVRLIHLCDLHSNPRYFVDDLMKILKEYIPAIPPSISNKGQEFSPHKAVSRDNFSKRIVETYGKNDRVPDRQIVTLPTPGDSRCHLVMTPKEWDAFFKNQNRGLPKKKQKELQEAYRKNSELPQEISSAYRNRVLLVKWNIKGLVEHLLSNHRLFSNLDNLVVNKDDPWLPFTSPDLDDVCSGGWYRDTVAQVKLKNGLGDDMMDENGMLVLINPLLIYGDKTGGDSFQRFSMEPWVVTMALFRRFIRYHPWAWRLLGFIPDLDLKSRATKEQQRNRYQGMSTAHYHFCMASLLEGFEEISREGIVTIVRIGNEVRKVRMILPVALILNDGKSGDTLVCRFGSYSKGTNGLSRRCLCSFEDSDNPCHKCELRDDRIILEHLTKGEVGMGVEAAKDMLGKMTIQRIKATETFEEKKPETPC
jgi:hypothetical protein